MRILQALKILEAATVECRKREIDTPEVREALAVLQPYCRPEWRITGFRHSLKPSGDSGVDREGQQQILSVYFSGIHTNVRQLLSRQIGKLNYRYRKTNDAGVKAEADRLTSDLAALPERWQFVDRMIRTPGSRHARGYSQG